MKTENVAGLLPATLSSAAWAQRTMPPGYVDYVTQDIRWKYVDADGQGTLTFSLPQCVEPAQTGSTCIGRRR
ncbi:MAG: hypothetical protein KF889_16240 [Alphaproteobacteria bacterium]|nr:hypothetical protein [Alphaproteobacteria bacterium]MCW5740082.1 hypothetical protein [Alphaproteobacteria bacterium]